MRAGAVRRLLLSVLALTVVACSSPGAPPPTFAVGASTDPENALLANIYAAGLRYYGTAAEVQTVGDPLSALDGGKLSVATGFTGSLLHRLDPDSTARSAEQVYRALAGALPEGIAVGDYATAAQDKPALAVTEASASAWDSRDLAALVARCSQVSVGMLAGVPVPDSLGDCALRQPRQFATQSALFDALRAGAVTAVWTSTATTGIPDGVVVLVDRKPALIPAQNVVALYRRNTLNEMQLRAINEIAGVLDTTSLVAMLTEAQAGADPRALAEEWLAANPLGH